MDEPQTDPSNSDLLQQAYKDYARLNRLALVAWAVGAVVVVAGFLIPYSNGIFSSAVIAPVYLLTLWPTLVIWRRSKEVVETTDPHIQREKYDKLRNSQEPATVLVTIGAVAMIPGALILIQMMPVGWAILFNLYAGAIIGLRLRAVHRRVQYFRQQGLEQVSTEENPYKSPQAVLPPDVKRPIGEVFVWGGGITILAINLMMELSAYSAIRNYGITPDGILKDYGAQLGFALGQVFDLLVLSVFGVLLLILALINQTRVTNKRKNLIAIAIVVAGLVIFPGSISRVLAGAAGPSESLAQTREQAQKSTDAIRTVMANGPVPGFEGVYEEFYDCAADVGCSDSLMRLANEIGPEPKTLEYCTGIVNFAIANGISTWRTSYEANPIEIEDGGEAAIYGCNSFLDDIEMLQVQQVQAFSGTFILEGVANFGEGAPLRFAMMHAIDGNEDDNPGFHTYFLEISTTYEWTNPCLDCGLSQGTLERNDLLQLIGQERLANPDRAPMDKAFMTEILSKYPHDIPIEMVENSDGEIHRLHITDSDGAELCLSIEPWESDPANEGIPDPGQGYGLGYMESLEVLRGFGNAVNGSCG